MKTFYCIAVVLASVGNNVYANGGIATPFGIKMGEPGSCSTIDKKFRGLDPAIQSKISARDKTASYEALSYWPSEKLFPGATRNVVVSCIEGKLWTVAWGVEKGDYDRIFWDVIMYLNLKYQRSAASNDPVEILKEGGRIIYHAVESEIAIDVPKKGNAFFLGYQYTGPMTNSDIEVDRKEKEKMLHRKGAL